MSILLTLAEAANALHISQRGVLRLIAGEIPNRPALPSVRLGRRVLIRRETLDRFIEQAETVNSPA